MSDELWIIININSCLLLAIAFLTHDTLTITQLLLAFEQNLWT